MSKVNFTFVIHLLFTISSFSQIKVTSLEQDINLNSSVEFFTEEKNTPLSYKDAKDYFLNGKALKSSSDKPINFGSGINPIWLKISFDPENDISKVLHLRCPYIQKLDFYTVEDQIITYTKSGKYADLNTKGGLKPKDFAWTLKFKKNLKKDVFIRIDTNSPLIIPLTLKTFDSYVNYRSNTYILYGLYFGILIVMFLYNLFIAITLSDKTYYTYTASVFFTLVIFSSSNGFVSKYLIPHNWEALFYLSEVAMSLALIPTGLFAIFFLDLSKTSKVSYNIILFMMTLSIPAALYSRFMESPKMASTIVAIHTIALLTVGIISVFKRTPFAKYYVLAWTLYLIGGLLVTLRNIGYLPSNIYTDNGAEIGSALEVCLLAFALAHKYRALKKEKNKLQKEHLKLIENQNEKLELLVNERTYKLNETIEELNATLNYLNENQHELELKNNNITSSINYALNIQQAILPNHRKLASIFKDYSHIYIPKDIVSGDFVFYEEQNGLKFFAVADCTGHGVPGAIMTMLSYNILYELVKVHQITDPAEILYELDQKLKKRIHQNEKLHDGLDIALIIIDTTNDLLHFSGAVNGLFILDINLNSHYLKGTKRNIGDRFRLHEPFITKSIALSSIHWIYLFSDGFQDQFNHDSDEKYTKRRLKEFLKSHVNKDGTQQSILMTEEFKDWKGLHDQVDDVTIAGIKFNECITLKAS